MEMTVKIDESMRETGENRGWIVVNVKVVLGLVGAAACVAWLLVALLMDTSFTASGTGQLSAAIAHAAFLAGVVVATAAAVPLSDFWSTHRAAYLAAGACLAVAGMACALFSWASPALLWTGFGVSGLGMGALYTLYGEYLSYYFSNGIEPYTQSVLLIAVAFVLGYFLITPGYRFVYWVVAAALAFLGYVAQMAFFKVHRLPHFKWADAKQRSKVPLHSYLSTNTGGILVGFSLSALFCLGAPNSSAMAVGAGLAVAVCGFFLYDSFNKRLMVESVSMRWFLPITAVLAFPMLFTPRPVAFCLAVAMTCFAVLPTSCSLSAICRHIHLCDLAAIGQFGFGRLWEFVGILVGLAVGYVGFSTQFTELLGHYGITAAVCVFVLLVILSCSFVMVEDNYPTDERIRVVEDETGGKTVTVGPGTPIHALPVPEPRMESADEPRVGIFQLKCDIVSEKYGLSKRQSEVLAMLARGRGAEYITEKLVISPHTAKAHTYNIYLKLDVHSRQELMDLVESTVVTDGDIARAQSRLP